MKQCCFAVHSLWNVFANLLSLFLIDSIDITKSLATGTLELNANNFVLSVVTQKWVDELLNVHVVKIYSEHTQTKKSFT